MLYVGLVAGALALIVQSWAQAHLDPTRAAIAMTMEPVFASAFAVTHGGENLTVRMLVGVPA
ncbi:MAG: EamA family transporter [Kribbellaceae bacterium]